jgi:hypothetical protein
MGVAGYEIGDDSIEDRYGPWSVIDSAALPTPARGSTSRTG